MVAVGVDELRALRGTAHASEAAAPPFILLRARRYDRVEQRVAPLPEGPELPLVVLQAGRVGVARVAEDRRAQPEFVAGLEGLVHDVRIVPGIEQGVEARGGRPRPGQAVGAR